MAKQPEYLILLEMDDKGPLKIVGATFAGSDDIEYAPSGWMLWAREYDKSQAVHILWEGKQYLKVPVSKVEVSFWR